MANKFYFSCGQSLVKVLISTEFVKNKPQSSPHISEVRLLKINFFLSRVDLNKVRNQWVLRCFMINDHKMLHNYEVTQLVKRVH